MPLGGISRRWGQRPYYKKGSSRSRVADGKGCAAHGPMAAPTNTCVTPWVPHEHALL
jgi:hypothetical protein